MAPKYVILDIAPAVNAFVNFSVTLPMSEDYSEHELVLMIFDYIQDHDTAYESMCEFVRDMQEMFIENYPIEAVRLFGNSLHTLGNAIINRLIVYGMYEKSGAMWYNAVELIDGDVVLKRVTEEDLIN